MPGLFAQATPVFNKLVDIAARTPRNIILDQTNVYPSARRRKAGNFHRFGTRRCVTIVRAGLHSCFKDVFLYGNI